MSRSTQPPLKVGYTLSYWAGGPPPDARATIREAERLGVDSLWTAEAYGSDALTPLAWWGSETTRVRLGTAVAQISARPPAAAAMAAMTLDHLSDGRFVLGLGVSGPQVVSGWYGQPFDRPVARTREYVGVLRDVWAREAPVTNDGPHYPLPLPTAAGGSPHGKPLKSSIRPLRSEIPVFLGAEGPRNVALGAEICDGWITTLYSPRHDRPYRDALAEGFARPGARRTAEEFEVAAIVPVVVDDDLERAADRLRPRFALYLGGMGARGANFHADVAARMGHEALVDRVQELYGDGRKDAAAAAIPTELIESWALVGPPDKIRHDLDEWRESLATTLVVTGDLDALRTTVELVHA